MEQQQIITLCGMEDSVRRLIGLYCMQCPPEKEIADWFSLVELEALRPEVSCMAAAMAAANDYVGTPLNLVPRLRGILRYVHTLNSGMMAGLCALGKQLNEADIPALLIGSTAVHLGYPEPARRHIWHTQIGVPETDFPRAAALAAAAGFTVQHNPYSVTARCGNTQCVLIQKGMDSAPGATKLLVNGVPFLMPCSAELLVSLAEAMYQALATTESGAKLIPWIMDLHCVITANPDWNSIAAVAAKRGTCSQVRLILELYNSLAPNVLAGEVMNLFGTEDTAAHLAQLFLKYRNIQPGRARLKRLWLSARINSGGSLSKAVGAFLKVLGRVGIQKLTPGS